MLLTDKDRDYLDACDEGGTCAVGRMLSYLDRWQEEGIAEGRFTKEEAEADLEAALYRAFALLQDDQYLSYAQVVTTLEKARGTAGNSGVWHYRMACGLTHIGRLDEALHVAEAGVRAEPDYPWGWLHLGRLRAHFGDQAGAFAAAEHGLALVPDDPEFLQLLEEIEAGIPLPAMMCHYINPEFDEDLQNLQMDLKEVLAKQLALTCLIKDPKGFEDVKEAFGITLLKEEPDAPACLGADIVFSPGPLHVVFRMNEAGFSHLTPAWVRHFKEALEEFLHDKHCDYQDILEVWLDLDRTVHVVLTPEDADGDRRVIRFKVNGGLSNERAIPEYAQSMDLDPDTRSLLEHIGQLNEEDRYDEIVRILEDIPDQERHPVLTHELARAHNNLSSPMGDGLLRAIALLNTVKSEFENTFEWQFRMGYALFYRDRDDEALEYFEKAESLRKGDHDTLELLRACREQIAFPRFTRPYAQRVEDVWETFLQKTTDWQKRLAQPSEIPAVLNEMERVVQEALPETSVTVGSMDGIVEVILSTNGNYLNLYPLRAMVRAMPDILQCCWKMTLCRPALPSCEGIVLEEGLREYAADDLFVWETPEKDGALCLTLYTKAFETLEEEEVEDAFRAVNRLLDDALGEVVHMKHYGRVRLSRAPESMPGYSLPEFVRHVRESVPERLNETVDGYIDEPLEFQWRLENDKGCDYLLDAERGRASCPALVSSYFYNEHEPMRQLHQFGATAGMLYVDSADHDATTRSAVRDELRRYLSEKLSHVYESFGQIEGRDFAYDLFFSWDLSAVLSAVNAFGEQHDEAVILGFHSFFREAGGVTIKNTDES